MRTHPPPPPWRGPGPGRPAGVPLPPARMPLLRSGRPLKRWTWVGAFGADVMVCAAQARVGVAPVAWWAVWDRSAGVLAQGGRGVTVSPDRVRVRSRTVGMELSVGDGAPVEVVSPHGVGHIWTRKRAGVPARGWVELHGTRRPVELHAVVDESAGYHARRTAWRWSAGVGVSASGAAVAWNLVTGLHDDPRASERTVWVDGVPHAVDPVAFGEDLGWVADASGAWRLAFTPGAVRARREHWGLVASDYEQPFGAFAGTLPVAGPLAEGHGVMERHVARW